jgi:hypothetical protein
MSMQRIGITGGSISMTNRTADKLIDRSFGDGALLFLYLLRVDGNYDPYAAAKALHWDIAKVSSVFTELENMELVKGVQVEKIPVVKAADAPEYTAEMITQEIEAPASPFPALVNEVERKLGNKLSLMNLRILMELYDYLALPSEVIYLLVSFMVDDTAYRKGPGVLPKMWEIKREAYRWASKGLDSLETATSYVEKMSYLRTHEGALLAAVGITGRHATERERTYLNSWVEMGFAEDAVQLAYELTLFNIKVFRWSYCNGILKRWHKDNLHTMDEIVSAERKSSRMSTASDSFIPGVSPADSGGKSTSTAQASDLAWLQDYMKKRENNPNQS